MRHEFNMIRQKSQENHEVLSSNGRTPLQLQGNNGDTSADGQYSNNGTFPYLSTFNIQSLHIIQHNSITLHFPAHLTAK